jgi:hypothetical protein
MRPSSFAALLALAACSDKTTDTGASITVCDGTCVLEDVNNFTYVTDLSIGTVDLQATSDFTIDWSGLTTDLQGHAVDPMDIDQVRVVIFPELSKEDIAIGLSSDTLQQSDVGGYFLCSSEGRTSCVISEFGLLGSVPGLDTYFIEGSGSWLFALGTDGEDGSRTAFFGEPLDSSSNTTASVTDDISSLTIDVDLHSLSALGLAAGETPTLDWSATTIDGLGNELFHEKIDLLEVGYYDLTVTEVEDNFFDLRTLATSTWTMDIEGETTADLALLEGDVPFTGVNAEGTWLAVWWCTSCENPVPKIITRLVNP